MGLGITSLHASHIPTTPKVVSGLVSRVLCLQSVVLSALRCALHAKPDGTAGRNGLLFDEHSLPVGCKLMVVCQCIIVLACGRLQQQHCCTLRTSNSSTKVCCCCWTVRQSLEGPATIVFTSLYGAVKFMPSAESEFKSLLNSQQDGPQD